MTSRSEPAPPARAAAGFTLVELLIVLAIMAAATTLFLTRIGTGSTGAELRAATREMTAALNETRSFAVARNRVAAVMIEPGARRYRDPRREHVLSPRVALTTGGLVVPAGDGATAIYFFPDGSASGGELRFTAGAASETVSVDWFTGHAGAQAIRAASR